jgi:hypothetical protein
MGVKTNWYHSIERPPEVTLLRLLVAGDITNWYHIIERHLEVMLFVLLVARDVKNWYQSQGSSTEPRWAGQVVIRTKVQREMVPRGYLGHVIKLRRCSGIIKP